ncbi:hypothetical protein Noda2021_04740 [Candidatus Dependentiae bacterium Noda2021]|nr:hypothetical protein Noda2021_04740 [Candidatus Dependentiae bacterium Noda2021]
MISKSRLFNTFNICVLMVFSLAGLSCNIALPQAPFPAPNGKGAALSPEDLKMLNEVEQEINKFVGSLSPEEQKSFWKDVDELTKVMNTMSEEELVKFMEDVFQEENQPKPEQPVAPVVPAPVVPPVIEQPKPIKPEALKAQEKALVLIDSLITKINNFIGKTQLIPQLAADIAKWAREDKLKDWPATLSWTQFKKQVEELETKLNKLKDRNPVTNQYKHLDEFIKNEALYNNVSKLNTALTTYEPKIELPSFVLEKMTDEAKVALRKVIDNLIEALTVLQIPSDIEAVLEKYEPTAKTIKEQQEELRKRAQQTPGVKQGSTIVGGKREEPVDRFKTEYFPEPYYPPFQPDMYFPAEQPRGQERPEGTKKGEEQSKTPEAPAKKDEEKKEEKKFEQDKVAESHITNAEAQLTNIAGIVDDFKPLKNLKDFLYSSDPISKDLFNEAFAGLNKAARDGRNALRSLKLRMNKLDDKEKSKAKQSVQDLIKEYSNTLNKLSTQISDAQSSIGGFSPERQWAFFAIEPSDANRERVDNFKKNSGISSPVNLTELRSRIDELKKALEAI